MSMLPTTTVPVWLILSTWQPTCWNGYGRSETCHFHTTDDGNYRVDQTSFIFALQVQRLPWRLVLWSGVPGRTLASPQVAIENINDKLS